MRFIERRPKILILRMRHVPIIDATGLKVLEEVCKESLIKGTKIILSEIRSEKIMEELKKARLIFSIGKANITESLQAAIDRSNILLEETKKD